MPPSNQIQLTVEFLRNGRKTVATHILQHQRASLAWDAEKRSLRLETSTDHIHYPNVESFRIQDVKSEIMSVSPPQT